VGSARVEGHLTLWQPTNQFVRTLHMQMDPMAGAVGFQSFEVSRAASALLMVIDRYRSAHMRTDSRGCGVLRWKIHTLEMACVAKSHSSEEINQWPRTRKHARVHLHTPILVSTTPPPSSSISLFCSFFLLYITMVWRFYSRLAVPLRLARLLRPKAHFITPLSATSSLATASNSASAPAPADGSNSSVASMIVRAVLTAAGKPVSLWALSPTSSQATTATPASSSDCSCRDTPAGAPTTMLQPAPRPSSPLVSTAPAAPSSSCDVTTYFFSFPSEPRPPPPTSNPSTLAPESWPLALPAGTIDVPPASNTAPPASPLLPAVSSALAASLLPPSRSLLTSSSSLVEMDPSKPVATPRASAFASPRLPLLSAPPSPAASPPLPTHAALPPSPLGTGNNGQDVAAAGQLASREDSTSSPPPRHATWRIAPAVAAVPEESAPLRLRVNARPTKGRQSSINIGHRLAQRVQTSLCWPCALYHRLSRSAPHAIHLTLHRLWSFPYLPSVVSYPKPGAAN